MRRLLLLLAFGLSAFCNSPHAQEKPAQIIKGPDERFKTDILVVVAHPDDEGGVTRYLARAIYNEHKRVEVVYATSGGRGGNDLSRVYGHALGEVCKSEECVASSMLGISTGRLL